LTSLARARTAALPVDALATVDAFRRFRDTTTDRRRRSLLDVCCAHAEAELLAHDLDAVMDTLNEDPHYADYGLGAPTRVDGREGVREHYRLVTETP
jgi:hypothetical protein